MGTFKTPSPSPSPTDSLPLAPGDSRLTPNAAVAPLPLGHATTPSDAFPRHLQSSVSGPSSGSSSGGAESQHNTDAEPSRAQLRSEIEMDPLTPAGHRRRRSSLMNPAGGVSGSGRSSRPRGLSLRSQADDLEDDKIIEESNTGAGALRPLDRGDDSVSDEDLHDDEETGLTTKDKRRKKQKKRRNTLLDQRIARETITAEEKREADQNVVKKSLINITLIGLWYLFSLSISIVSGPGYRKGTWAYARHNSTTSGCSTPANSTFPFPCSQRRCTCWCSSRLHL